MMLRHVLASAEGHLWTVAPLFAWRVRPEPLPAWQPWQTALDDAEVGLVTLTGALHPGDSHTLLIAVHGLGGDIDSHYMHRAAIAARAAGIDCLRLNLRGADLSGHDFYHAGLIDDVRAAAESATLAHYRRILLIGYSIGGHLVLRYAAAAPDPRLAAVAAICPPLDLARAARDIDAASRWAYRRHVLTALKDMLPPTAARRPLPLPLSEALRIERVRQWDERLVVPRFGFNSVEHYYDSQSAARHLETLRVPALVVATRHDPMVLAAGLEDALARAPELLAVRWLARAGHVGFPPRTTLGLSAPAGLEHQAIAWLLAT
jgi:predicted alpha/beta-fold hydrolase